MTRQREAQTTLKFIDDYCQHYRELLSDVRNYESFSLLHVGLLSEIPRKSLPAIARAVGETNAQALHHFWANSEWTVQAVRDRRLALTQQALAGYPITLWVDETGDKKKGDATDYVARQYMGNLHQTANGMVSVNTYGIWTM